MTPPAHTIQDTSALLIDVNGTLRVHGEAVPGAADFLRTLKKRGVPFALFSNNSQHSHAELSAELNELGFALTANDIITSGTVTAEYLHTEGKNEITLVGSQRFEKILADHGITSVPEAKTVVVGLDKQLTYNTLMHAARLIQSGALYVATDGDPTIMTRDGVKPGVGATLAYLKAITARDPDVVIGKPHAPMLQAALKKFNTTASQLGIIGDRLYADMKLAQESGLVSALVLSGATTQEEVSASQYQPDYVVQSIENLTPLFA